MMLYSTCSKLDFPRSVFWQQNRRGLHPSLCVITLIILQKWQIEAPFSLWGDWLPNKQTGKKRSNDVKLAETNSSWFSSSVLGAPGGRTGGIMRKQHQVLGSSHMSTRHRSELKSGLSFVSVYLARSLAIILLFISQRRWARPLICTLGLVGGAPPTDLCRSEENNVYWVLNGGRDDLCRRRPVFVRGSFGSNAELQLLWLSDEDKANLVPRWPCSFNVWR